jgi:hypothetical protein
MKTERESQPRPLRHFVTPPPNTTYEYLLISQTFCVVFGGGKEGVIIITALRRVRAHVIAIGVNKDEEQDFKGDRA